MKPRSYDGPVLIIIAALMWSFDGLLRRSLYVLPPLVVVFYEHLIGFLLLLPFITGHFGQLKSMTKKTWGAMAWVTILSSIIGTLLYTAALGKIQFIQFSVVVLLQQLQPLFVIVFGHLVLKERASRMFWGWLAIALVGAYFISFPTLRVNFNTGSGTIFAALMAVGAAFAWGSSTAFSRYALLQLPSNLTTGIRFGLAAAGSFALLLVTGQGAAVLTINETQIAFLLAIALSTGMVALTIYYRGLKSTPAWISSVCELTWPLSAVVIDFAFFHKTLTGTQWIGTALLLLSIYSVSKANTMLRDAEILT